jgi:hypothetical protein
MGITMLKYCLIFVLILSAPQFLQSQTITHTVDTFKVDGAANTILGLSANIYQDDFFLGLSYQFQPADLYGLLFFASFHVRPYNKRVLYKESEDVFYIFKENQYQLYIGTGYSIDIYKTVGLYTNISINPIAAFYRGSEKGYTDLIAPVAELGINRSNSKGVIFQLGYRHRNTNENKHGIYLNINFPLFK